MIEARNITFRYPHGTEAALEEVSVRIDRGEIVGIVGPNGSGKSTLGRVIKGLLRPTTGTVLVDNCDAQEHNLEVRRLVGLVFQNPNSQIVNAVVEQEVAFGLENIGLPSDEIRRRVDRALRAVGLQGEENTECHSLSMARKQRVALASVIAMQPQYLILDEATAWLEPAARWTLLDEVLRWGEEQGAGLIFITHRMDEAQLCDRLYGMLDGRVRVTGTPEEVLGNEEVRSELALDVPEALVLADELRAAGLPVERSGGINRLAEAICRS